jgi:N6-adenosine-specific RNA methylase IME4
MSARQESLPALISAAERALAVATDFEAVKSIVDYVDGLKAFAKKIGADTRQLSVIKLKAEKRLGIELKKQPKAKAGRPRSKIGTAKVPISAPKLADLGVTKKQSAVWRRIAEVDDEKFATYIATAEEVTTGGLLKTVEPERKKKRRAARERDLAEKTREASKKLGVGLFGVIYADPPWRFEPYSRDTGMDRAADNHYPTMEVAEIAALNIPAAPDCVLFLWATAPMLPQALSVLEAWGFDYRTHFVWAKPKIGTGFWNRNQHELLLLGVKGKVPAPAQGDQYPSLIPAALGAHSEKPAHFAEIIEDMFPNARRLEIFARSKRLGWDVWGNET